MKIIHCADLHLDSEMRANLNSEKAKIRRSELLNQFKEMVNFAVLNGIEAILIAGDMFDVKKISATTKNTVLDSIKSNPGLSFYYLKGNHDNNNFLDGDEDLPDNLYMFDTEWQYYDLADGKIVVAGVELSPENVNSSNIKLNLDNGRFNIVMLHGQESNGVAKDKAEVINLNAFKNKGIDYMALGHIHSYRKAKLDERGVYCYPGCLEGRGFDETGEHGFVLLDIDEDSRRYSSEFIPFAKRRIHELHVDITDLMTSAEIIKAAENIVTEKAVKADDLVKFVLEGEIDLDCEKNISYFTDTFADRFFFVKTYDESQIKVNYEDYRLDESLKGEFVRNVMDDSDIAEGDKARIIKLGLKALSSEKLTVEDI